MPYELELLAGKDEALDPGAADAELRERLAEGGVVSDADGGFDWQVEGTRIEVRTVLPPAAGDRSRHTVRLPFGAVEEEVGKAFERLLEAAAAAGLTTFAPQLGDALGRRDGARALASWREANRYALEYGGQVEDPRASRPARRCSSPSSRRARSTSPARTKTCGPTRAASSSRRKERTPFTDC